MDLLAELPLDTRKIKEMSLSNRYFLSLHPGIIRVEDKKHFDEAMKKGYIRSAFALLILVGVAGAGKSLFKRLVLGLPIPEFSPSTPLAEATVRAMSLCQVAIKGITEWAIVGPKRMIEIVAEKINEREVTDVPQNESSTSASALGKTGASGGYASATKSERYNRFAKSSYATKGFGKFCGKRMKDMPLLAPSSDFEISDLFTEVLKEIQVDTELIQKISRSKMDLMALDFVYVLDSGGQPPFREMLPLFVQQCHAIVLMQKLNENLDFKPTIKYRSKDGKEDKGYISQLTNNQILHQYVQAVQSHDSKVFVIGSHRDREDECQAETRKEKDKRLLEALRPILGNHIVLHKMGGSEHKLGGSADELMFPVNSMTPAEEDQKVADGFRKKVMEICMDEKRIFLYLGSCWSKYSNYSLTSWK